MNNWILQRLFYIFLPLAILFVGPNLRLAFTVGKEQSINDEDQHGIPKRQLPPTIDGALEFGNLLKDEDHRAAPERRSVIGEPLNIVLFYADDWTMKVLGKLNPDVKTPNIDRMADKGVLFSNNCVTTSVCWISRATLMTGVYASQHLETEPSSLNMFTTNPW